LPVAVLSLSALGLVSYKLLSTTRPYAVTLIMILVAVVSPTPDPFTFFALSVPGIAIYELCIWLVWLMERRKRNKEISDAAA
jgi:sec-independent protein translocase protein TatC